MTLSDLQTKSLEEILSQKAACLLVLQEPVYQKMKQQLPRLTAARKNQLKKLILQGLEKILNLQADTNQQMKNVSDAGVKDLKEIYTSARKDMYKEVERQEKTKNDQTAEKLMDQI